jgi:predicted benzoate:H+ symporter BenE
MPAPDEWRRARPFVVALIIGTVVIFGGLVLIWLGLTQVLPPDWIAVGFGLGALGGVAQIMASRIHRRRQRQAAG